ncbi:alpha/beta hydrolase [Labilibacter marinus]|uniref:alpha/beta hydrolase n=1 Tax=Labilibacter marinus TaxID=1477105 RepID=UPI00094F901B|nr:alpha/beta hydrolase [Labilibacter marinus]
MKTKYKILVSISTLIVAAVLVFGNIAGRLIIQINNNTHRAKHVHKPLVYGLKDKKVVYTSKDGLKLSAILVQTEIEQQKGTVILVHGIRSGKEHYLPVSKLLSKHGYNSVLVDLRAHGQSEGKYTTFGYHEKYDMSILVDSLMKMNNVSHHIGIWGNSLGAAVSLQAMSIDKRIKFGIIESTFADFKTVVHEYSAGTVGFNVPILNNYAIWWAEIIGDFNGKEVVPSEAVKNISQAVMMVHGTVDSNIDIKYGKKNFKNLASTEKSFVEVPNANHGNVWQVGGERYFQQVIDFADSVSMKKVSSYHTAL